MFMAEIKHKSYLKWRDKALKRYEFYVHKINDKEVYDYLESLPNKRQFIIGLIKDYLKKR